MDDFIPVAKGWKVDPAVQAQRDQDAAALKQEYEPDFIPVAKPVAKAEDDFIPVPKKKEIGVIPTMTSGAMAAVDFLAPTGLAVGGASALGGLITDPLTGNAKNLDELWANAAKRGTQYSDWSPSGILQKLGVPKEYVESPRANAPMEYLGEQTGKLGEKTLEATGSPALATAADVGSQIAALGLITHGAGKVAKATLPEFKRPAELPKTATAAAVDDLIGNKEPVVAPPEGTPTPATMRQVPRGPGTQVPDLPIDRAPDWTTDKGAAPPPVDHGETIPYDPLVEKLQGEAATPLSARDAGVDRPLDLGLPIDESPAPELAPWEKRGQKPYDKYAKGEEPTTDGASTQGDLLTEPKPESMKTPVDKARETPGFLRTAEDLLTLREEKQRPTEPTHTNLESAEGPASRNEPGLADLAVSKTGTNLRTYLDHIIATETNPLVKGLARILNKITGDVPVELSTRDFSSDRTRGLYNPGENKVILHPEKGLNRGTILHEATHAALVNFQRLHPNHPYVKAINLLHEITLRDLKLNGGLEDLMHTMKDPLEFIADALARPEFQDRLGKIQLGLKDQVLLDKYLGGKKGLVQTAWDALQAITGKIVGHSNRSVLHYALKSGAHIIDEGVPHPDVQNYYAKRASEAFREGNISTEDLKKGTALSDVRMGADEYKDLIRKYLINSKDLAEFQDSLKTFSDNPEYVRDIVSRAKELWDAKGDIISKDTTSRYSQLDKATKLHTSDLRPNDLFQKEELKHDEEGNPIPLARGEDISHAGRLFNTSATAQQINYGKMGGRWLKNVINNVQEIVNQGQKHFRDMGALVDAFGEMKRGDQRKITQTWIDFDGIHNNQLRDRGLQWPTTDMLREKGLNTSQIRMYEQLTRAFDKSYDLIAASFRKMGQEPPTKIPGYFPHFWEGAYKVLIRDGAGNKVAMRAFKYADSARRYMNYLEREGKDGLKGEMQMPSAEVKAGDLISTWMDAASMYGDAKNGLNKAILDRLLALDESSKRGIIKDVLERTADLKGHLAEEGFGRDWFGFNKSNTRLTSAFMKHLESVSQFWTNVHICSDVGRPFHEAVSNHLLDQVPNTKHAINEFIARSTGHPVNRAAFIDEGLRHIAISMGIPPTFFHTVGGSMSGLLSFMKLVFPNPRFYLSNVFQPLSNISDLSRIHMERLINGGKGGDVAGALKTFFEESVKMQNGTGSPEFTRALKYAVDNNIISVQQADHINPMGSANIFTKVNKNVLGKITSAIEERGRAVVFLQNYAYFRTVMSEFDAMQAAKHQVDMSMGNYQGMNSASMYTDFGILGNSLRPFGILRNVYFGKAFQSMQLLTNAMRDAASDPKKATMIAMAVVPIASAMGLYLVMAGGTGVLGAAEYDMIARWWNPKFKNFQIPRIQEVLRWSNAPDWMKFGALGTMLGWDIGPSLNAPSMTELGGIPGADALYNLGIIMKGGIDQASGKGMNAEELFGAFRALSPNITQGYIDDIIKKQQGAGRINPESRSLEAGTYRTPHEDLLYKLSGAKAITEVDRNIRSSTYKYENSLDAGYKAEQLDKILNAITQVAPGQDVSKLIQQAYEVNRGLDPGKLQDEIMSRMKDRMIDQNTQHLMKIWKDPNQYNQANDIAQFQRLLPAPK